MNKHVKIIVTLIVVAILAEIHGQSTNYCKIESCGDKPHTACLYNVSISKKCFQNENDSNKWLLNLTNLISQPIKTSKACLNHQGSGLTEAEKRNILNYHNKFRQKVADGRETRGDPGPQPSAVDMSDLVREYFLNIVYC